MFLGPFGIVTGFITIWSHTNLLIHNYQGPYHRPPSLREQPAHFNSQYHNLVFVIAHLAQETCAAQSQYHNSQYESLKDLAVPTYHACYHVLNHK